MPIIDPGLRRYILSRLYEAWAEGKQIYHFAGSIAQATYPRQEFENGLTLLDEEGLVAAETGAYGYSLSAAGVIQAESEGIAERAVAEENDRVRVGVIRLLKERWQANGAFIGMDSDDLAKALSAEPDLTFRNLLLLQELGFAEAMAGTEFRATSTALEKADEWEQRESLLSAFNAVAALEPAHRGLQLEHLIAKVVATDDWAVEGVSTTTDQLDVVVSRDREYYLVECKWLKDPVGASVIRDFSGKVLKRLDTRGIIISMSGFTSSAIQEVVDEASRRVILLFGEQDVKRLVHGTPFTELLNAKYHDFITRRTISWH